MNPQSPHESDNVVAPLPVLGGDRREAQAQQPWASVGIPGKLFGIVYKHDTRGYLRCQVNMFAREFFPLVLAGLIPMAVLIFLLLVGGISIHSAVNSFALILIAFSIWYVLGKISYIQSVVQPMGKDPGGLWLCALNEEGFLSLADHMPVSGMKWQEIKTIQYSGGDIYLFAKVFTGKFGYSGCAIPRSAFADTETAKRFYDLLLAVWESKDKSAVLQSVASSEFVVEYS